VDPPPVGAIVDPGGDSGGFLAGTQGDDEIYGLGGDDEIHGLGGDDLICGGAGGDTIVGEGGNDVIEGDGGQDILLGEAGDDEISGGPCEEPGCGDLVAYQTAPGDVTVDLAAGFASGADGADTLTGLERVFGSIHDDTLLGDQGNNALTGGPGDDFIDGREPESGRREDDNDIVTYLDATTSVLVNLSGGTALGGGVGSDTLRNIESASGSDFSDQLFGSDDPNTLRGHGDLDDLWGRGGDDLLSGGAGDDRLSGGAGSFDIGDFSEAPGPVKVDLVAGGASGGAGEDSISGVEGLWGSGFDDRLLGDAGENFFLGFGGDDRIDGRDLATVDGSPARDTILYTDSGPVIVNLRKGRGWNQSDVNQSAGDSLSGIEDVIGSPGDDILVGDFKPNGFQGRAGKDRIYGHSGNDSFAGDEGDDLMVGGRGRFDFVHYLFNGALDADLASGRVRIACTAVCGRRSSSNLSETDRIKGMEVLAGSPEDDVLRGSGRTDYLIGGAGRDTLLGREGNDTLKGSGISLLGSRASDGKAGRERSLDGGIGFDHCLGSAGDRRRCESSLLPAILRGQLRRLERALLADIKCKRNGTCRRG
jgi:Ca2+-binding RTX toxin-like protein